jgi:hypothetical protein
MSLANAFLQDSESPASQHSSDIEHTQYPDDFEQRGEMNRRSPPSDTAMFMDMQEMAMRHEFPEDEPIARIIMEEAVKQDFLDYMAADLDELGEQYDPADAYEDVEIQLDWGRSEANWQGFLEDLACRNRYEKVVDAFLFFHEQQEDCEESTLIKSMIAQFREQHNLGQYAPNTLRSRFSALKKFWLNTGRGDLSALAPLIETNLSKWDKTHCVKQARTFRKEEYGKFDLHYISLHMNSTNYSLPYCYTSSAHLRNAAQRPDGGVEGLRSCCHLHGGARRGVFALAAE